MLAGSAGKSTSTAIVHGSAPGRPPDVAAGRRDPARRDRPNVLALSCRGILQTVRPEESDGQRRRHPSALITGSTSRSRVLPCSRCLRHRRSARSSRRRSDRSDRLLPGCPAGLDDGEKLARLTRLACRVATDWRETSGWRRSRPVGRRMWARPNGSTERGNSAGETRTERHVVAPATIQVRRRQTPGPVGSSDAIVGTRSGTGSGDRCAAPTAFVGTWRQGRYRRCCVRRAAIERVGDVEEGWPPFDTGAPPSLTPRHAGAAWPDLGARRSRAYCA